MGDDWFAQTIYKDFIVHVLYTEKDKPIGEHEDTHLLSLPWGLSIALFQEGLAEYVVGKNWFGREFNEVVKEVMTKNILPSIESMMEHKKWLELDDENTIYYYSFCASFTKYLIETYGKGLYKELYMKTKRENSKEDNSNIFLDIFHKTPNEMEVLWKKWVNI